VIEWADPDSFEFLRDQFLAIDDNSVFARSYSTKTNCDEKLLKKIPWFDPKDLDLIMFEDHPYLGFVADTSNNIIYDLRFEWIGYNKIEQVDIETLKVASVNGHTNQYFTFLRDKNRLYQWHQELNIVDDADPETFKVLWSWIAVDKSNLYINSSFDNENKYKKTQFNPWLDIGSFKAVSLKEDFWKKFFEDKNFLYQMHHRTWVIHRVEWARSNSFEIHDLHFAINNELLYHNDPNEQIYTLLKWIPSYDFKFLTKNWYLISGWKLYYKDNEISYANLETFKDLKWWYISIDNKIVFKGETISQSEWFQPIDFDMQCSYDHTHPIFINDAWEVLYRWKVLSYLKKPSLYKIKIWPKILHDKEVISSGKLIWLTWCWSTSEIVFFPEYDSKIDELVLNRLINNTSREELRDTLEILKNRTSWYWHGTQYQAIEWALYRHIYNNLDMYYR